MIIRSISLGFTLLLLGALTAAAEEPLSVPTGSAVTVDGSFGDGEWADAARRDLTGGVELLAKQEDEFLDLAFRFTGTKHSGLDLYLAAPGGARRLFHISSELGTRTWTDGTWSDFDWSATGWSGNPVEVKVSENALTILEPDGFELRLGRSMLEEAGLGGDTLRLSFRLKRPVLTLPAKVEEAPLEEWLLLRLPATE